MATQRGTLGLGQRILLVAAWTVSCGFVFVLGFYVGKGVRGGHADLNPRIALPVDAPEPPEPPADEQAPLTFYDVLGAPGEHGAERATAPPPAPPAAAETPPAAVASREPAPAPAAEPAPVAPAPHAAAGAPAPPPVEHAPEHVAPHEPAPTPATPPAPPRAAAAVTPPPGAAPAGIASAPPLPPPPTPTTADGRWVVYANPTRDRLAAEHERAALRALGYPAEVVMLRRDRDVWYRVRVGRYATQTLAEEASRRVRGQGAGQAFVQSE